MSRIEFPKHVKEELAKRARYQCSYPTCNRITISQGFNSNESSNSGVASHIFSASTNGPRGQNSLSEKELRDIENGIWLCSDHGRIVDNNRGDRFPAQLLLSYKQMHEARIAHEHQGLYSPIGWIHEMRIEKSPLFSNNTKFNLTKLNLIIGNNCTGKTAICEWLSGFFNSSNLKRWRQPKSQIKLELTYFIPQEVCMGLTIQQNNRLKYSINNSTAPINPFKLNIISPRPQRYPISEEENKNALAYFAGILGVEQTVVLNLIDEIHSYKYSKIKNIAFVTEGNETIMCLDISTSPQGISFGNLSQREKERVFVEFLCAQARFCGKFSPTILILDSFISIIFDRWFEYYKHHFLDVDNHFQTILTIPTRDINLDEVKWNGWGVIHTKGKPPVCKII